jgi:hypothetical protein
MTLGAALERLPPTWLRPAPRAQAPQPPSRERLMERRERHPSSYRDPGE